MASYDDWDDEDQAFLELLDPESRLGPATEKMGWQYAQGPMDREPTYGQEESLGSERPALQATPRPLLGKEAAEFLRESRQRVEQRRQEKFDWTQDFLQRNRYDGQREADQFRRPAVPQGDAARGMLAPGNPRSQLPAPLGFPQPVDNTPHGWPGRNPGDLPLDQAGPPAPRPEPEAPIDPDLAAASDLPGEEGQAPPKIGVKGSFGPRNAYGVSPFGPQYTPQPTAPAATQQQEGKAQELWEPYGDFKGTAAQERVKRAAMGVGQIDSETYMDAMLDRQAQEKGMPRSNHAPMAVRNEFQRLAIQSHARMPEGPQKQQAIASQLNHSINTWEDLAMRNMMAEKTESRQLEVTGQKNENAKILTEIRHQNDLNKIQAQLDAALEKVKAHEEGRAPGKKGVSSTTELAERDKAEKEVEKIFETKRYEAMLKNPDTKKDVPKEFHTPESRAAEAQDRAERRLLAVGHFKDHDAAEALKEAASGLPMTEQGIDYTKVSTAKLMGFERVFATPLKYGVTTREGRRIRAMIQKVLKERSEAKQGGLAPEGIAAPNFDPSAPAPMPTPPPPPNPGASNFHRGFAEGYQG